MDFYNVSLLRKLRSYIGATLRKYCKTLQKGEILLNYGNFLKRLKPYCINKSIKNETLVNEPIAIIIENARLKKEKGPSKGETFYYETTEASRIINNRLELSDKIRNALELYNMEECIIKEFDAFYDTYINKSKVHDMVDEYLKAIRNDSSFQKHELEDIECCITKPSLFMAKILIKSLKEQNYIDNSEYSTIWSCSNRCINVINGDIFTYALGRRRRKKRIVVIPVNTSFDTHVTTKLEKEANPLVSINTLHGKLLIRLSKKGLSEAEVIERVKNNLLINNLISENSQNLALPIGTIATLDFDETIFYLLAISKFDENNNAHSSKEDIRNAIQNLIVYYDQKGQGYDLYLPLIGTGMSRANLNYQESYNLIVSIFLENKDRISGKINIVIQPEVEVVKNQILERNK